MRPGLATLTGLALVGLLLVGCGSDEESGAESTTSVAAASTTANGDTGDETEASVGDPEAPGVDAAEVASIGGFAVGSSEVDVVDDSRPTEAWGGQDELPQRTLPTLVLYPAEGDVVLADSADETTNPTPEARPDAKPADGPWPLVVFSHGRGGTGPAYANVLRAWASAGYVVLAPTYPLTSAETPDKPNTDDLVNQPADVSYLIDWATDLPEDDPLAGVIDPERIALSGHSLGGFTSLAAAYNPKLRDMRVDAVAEWAGAYRGQLADGGDPIQDGPPLLAIHGDSDDTVPYESAQQAVDAVGPPWQLLTLVDGEHTPPYVIGMGDPQSAVVTEASLDFFDAELKDDPDGETRLIEVVDQAGPKVATLSAEEA